MFVISPSGQVSFNGEHKITKVTLPVILTNLHIFLNATFDYYYFAEDVKLHVLHAVFFYLPLLSRGVGRTHGPDLFIPARYYRECLLWGLYAGYYPTLRRGGRALQICTLDLSSAETYRRELQRLDSSSLGEDADRFRSLFERGPVNAIRSVVAILHARSRSYEGIRSRFTLARSHDLVRLLQAAGEPLIRLYPELYRAQCLSGLALLLNRCNLENFAVLFRDFSDIPIHLPSEMVLEGSLLQKELQK